MSEKIKIIFIGHNFHFLDNIINNLNKDKYKITTHEIKLSTNELLKSSLRARYTSELLEIIGDNHIVWVEWLLSPICLLSQIPDKKFKLICRLHSYEYFYKGNIYIRSTNFINIDKVILVNDWFKYKLIQNFNISESKLITIPILFTEYSNQNQSNRQKNLGMVGINSLSNKGIDKVFDIFEKIYQIDPSYKLHIKGGEIKKYAKNPFLSDAESLALYSSTVKKINIFKEKYPEHIIFHPHTNNGGEDMETFYNHIGFLLCASIYESFHCSIMEAGSAGCIPIIYDHFQKDIPKTPEEYSLYKFRTEDDIVKFITTITEYQNKSLKTKKYYELLNRNCLDKYDKMIENIKNEPVILQKINPIGIYKIGVKLQANSSNIIFLQNQIIEISNQNPLVNLTIFINKNHYKSNNVTFIKCWQKGYLFGNSEIKIPKSINSLKLILREPTEEEFKNFNIIL